MQWCLAANRHTGSLEQRRESKSAHWKSGTEEGKEGRRDCSPLSEDDEAIFSGPRRTRHPCSRSRADRRRSRVGAARRRERRKEGSSPEGKEGRRSPVGAAQLARGVDGPWRRWQWRERRPPTQARLGRDGMVAAWLGASPVLLLKF